MVPLMVTFIHPRRESEFPMSISTMSLVPASIRERLAAKAARDQEVANPPGGRYPEVAKVARRCVKVRFDLDVDVVIEAKANENRTEQAYWGYFMVGEVKVAVRLYLPKMGFSSAPDLWCGVGGSPWSDVRTAAELLEYIASLEMSAAA